MPKVTRLGHVGLFVTDPEIMMEFYSTFLGMTVTDRDERRVFLSSRPSEEHHEILLAKNLERHTDPQQLSFVVDTLADLRGKTIGYFRALEIPLLRGRVFVSDEPAEPPEVVVNRALADRFWPGEDPIGKRIHSRGPEGSSAAVPRSKPSVRVKPIRRTPIRSHQISRSVS